ncbi:MAG TPA: helix-turn-helix domain-containing protein [Rugosimonospora sp.]|nr:helix-turn-helix domain-containing protein [Rugosimonospora sp.]
MPETTPARRRRVPALAPEERRAAIVAATVPLLREHGLAVSTRQIAEAAGVAEGTLFGVFADKTALLRAALVSMLDPERAVRAFEGIDPHLDLRARLVAALDVMRERFDRNAALMGALRAEQLKRGVSKEDIAGGVEFMRKMEHSRERIIEGITALIEPDRALLRRSPATTAHLLFVILMASSRAGFLPTVETMDNSEIVALLLDGLLLRPSRPRRNTHGGRPIAC